MHRMASARQVLLSTSGVVEQVVSRRTQLHQGGEGLWHPFRRQRKELSNDGGDDVWRILKPAGSLKQCDSASHYFGELPVPLECQFDLCLEFMTASIEIKSKAGEEGIGFQRVRQRGGAGIADLVLIRILIKIECG